MSDFDRISAYLTCSSCRAPTAVRWDIDFVGVDSSDGMMMMITKACKCDNADKEGTFLSFESPVVKSHVTLEDYEG